VTLPDIPIPYALHLDPCRRGSHANMELCLLCQRPIRHDETTHVVLLDEGWNHIIDPLGDRPARCYFDIDSDCWEDHPELHSYEVEMHQ